MTVDVTSMQCGSHVVCIYPYVTGTRTSKEFLAGKCVMNTSMRCTNDSGIRFDCEYLPFSTGRVPCEYIRVEGPLTSTVKTCHG